MTTKSFTAILIASVQLGFVAETGAQVVTYTLSGVTFSDGAAAEGSFDFSNGSMSNINITTTGGVFGNALPGYTYTNQFYVDHNDVQFCVTPNPFGQYWNNPGPAFLVLDLDNGFFGLGNPGTIALDGGVEEYGPAYGIGTSRSFQGGQLIGTEAPLWTTQPVSLVVSAGHDFTLTAQAEGFPLPTFQWQFSTNGSTFANINGATGLTYSSASSDLRNIGYYQVVAANSIHSQTSSPATVSFLNITINTNALATLHLIGPTGTRYQLQSAAAVGGLDWTTQTNVTVTCQPYVFVDCSSSSNQQQFYRAVPQ
jgi:hypothetical protein